MSEVIDLVTPPKPSARQAAEITFFDLTDETISPVSAQDISNTDNNRRGGDARDADCTPYIPSRFPATNSVTHSSPKRKKSRPLEPRTPPSLGGIADVCVNAILAGVGGWQSSAKECSFAAAADASTTKESSLSAAAASTKEECCFDDELIADAGLVESMSGVCPQLQLVESESYPPALNATVPTSSPTANATALGSCQVCPAGITSPVATGQKILQQRWVCDVCKVKWFLDFREACEHEESCGKVANKRTGGGGLPPPPEPTPPSSSSASSTSTTVSSRESSCVAAKNVSTSEESKEDNNDYIPSEGRQLYSEAEWLQNTLQQKHDVSVLTAYVILFHTLLSESSITSHVKGLNNVTHVSKLCSISLSVNLRFSEY